MPTALDLAAAQLDQEWADTLPYPAPAATRALTARTAAEALADEGAHVHLVSGAEVQCLNHRDCRPLPGV
ncbi:hypothetical protein ACFCYM_09860 [Streptomyces sp. NPDC056254]|uniref:hypothetical protein n=1 Tax=Streptomyces sp. NPDC056254 TaxID=3345763 RepID=UPI0035D646D4